VSKRASQKIDTERFNVKQLNKGDVKEQYQVTIRNKFAVLRRQWGHQQGMEQYEREYQNFGPRESRLL
jgi:hypothetical protein